MMEIIQQGHANAAARVGCVRHQGDAHHARFLGPRTSSQMRIVAHLWEERVLTRAEVDRIAGRANGPDVMLQLHRLGLTKGRRGARHEDVCVLSLNRELIDRDGLLVEAGVYRLTDRGLAAVKAWFEACDDDTTIRMLEALKR